MKAKKNVYWIISGEGERGTWERKIATKRGIFRILSRERCGGDRWAYAYRESRKTETGCLIGIDIETGERKFLGWEG